MAYTRLWKLPVRAAVRFPAVLAVGAELDVPLEGRLGPRLGFREVAHFQGECA